MTTYDTDSSSGRLTTQILILYYLEDYSQAEIAKTLGLSTAKVNRLIKQAREQGWVQITLRTPYTHMLETEHRLRQAYHLNDALIIPSLIPTEDPTLQLLGRAAADYLLQRLRDGDTICISGGKAVHAMVEAIKPRRSYRVRVVPATGARRGKLFTDVNYLAARLAERLGGEAFALNAPVFVDTPEEREALLSMRHISETLAMARDAQIAIAGIGSIVPMASSYFDLLASEAVPVEKWQRTIEATDAHGEIFAYVFNGAGELCLEHYNDRVVGLSLQDLVNIPLRIGVAATPEKVRPIHGALCGGYFSTLITDEATASSVLQLHAQTSG